ncbi:MAG: hypothetical protein K9K66_10430 [Desulfarculaceae bacterium]|nr:hypothetical protein [Desulfarculaceae bacterium]MCF8073912.1 hypothetical protein [Desulfarculaceae bacterium]MCF8102065.1 hypothetical protein [Desulfarculaceae bacterium]MCF8116336.1 hypothetical protein [Desulfarculaceae bacterium]
MMPKLLGCLALLLALSAPALADDLGQKIAAWCGDHGTGSTMSLTAAEAATYDQKTSKGYNFGQGTRFEFTNGEGVCTTTYTSGGGSEILATEDRVVHKSGNTLTLGKPTSK